MGTGYFPATLGERDAHPTFLDIPASPPCTVPMNGYKKAGAELATRPGQGVVYI